MVRFLVRRTLMVIPILFGIVTATFVLLRLLPGDPTYAILGNYATPAAVRQLRHQLGFDQSIGAQYVHYLGQVVRLDFGTTIATGRPVIDDLLGKLPATLELIVVALAIALPISI